MRGAEIMKLQKYSKDEIAKKVKPTSVVGVGKEVEMLNKEEIIQICRDSLVVTKLPEADKYLFKLYFETIADKISNRLGKPVMPEIAKERFYFDGTQITGYYGIRDKQNEDNLIWIDCPNNYLPVIIKALNSNFSV